MYWYFFLLRSEGIWPPSEKPQQVISLASLQGTKEFILTKMNLLSSPLMIRCSCRVVAIKRSRQLQTRDGLLRFTVKHSDIFRHHPLDLALLQPDCISRIATFIFILLKDTSLIMSHPNGKDSNQQIGLLTELPFWPFLCWSFEVFL